MKTIRMITTLALCIVLMYAVTSCVVVTKHDNGKHKGWNKNSNNPHHRNSTNPGKGKKN